MSLNNIPNQIFKSWWGRFYNRFLLGINSKLFKAGPADVHLHLGNEFSIAGWITLCESLDTDSPELIVGTGFNLALIAGVHRMDSHNIGFLVKVLYYTLK